MYLIYLMEVLPYLIIIIGPDIGMHEITCPVIIVYARVLLYQSRCFDGSHERHIIKYKESKHHIPVLFL